MQNALDSLLDFTIQESEFHKNYAEEIKNSILQPLTTTLTNLRSEKTAWLLAVDNLKKSLIVSQEKLKDEQAKLKFINKDLEMLEERKKKMMTNVTPNTTENLPAPIKKLDALILGKSKQKDEITKSWEASISLEEQCKEKMKNILSNIEKTEYYRIVTLSQIEEEPRKDTCIQNENLPNSMRKSHKEEPRCK